MCIRTGAPKFLYLILLVIAMEFAMSGCDRTGCKTEGAYHSCFFFPSKSQLSALQKGRAESSTFLKRIPSPSSSIQYDIFNKSALQNEHINIRGNFEGHTVNLEKTFFSNTDPKLVCNNYLSYFQSEKKLNKYEATSCGDRSYGDGRPVYVVSFGKHQNSDYISVFITINQGPFRTEDSKTWNSQIGINVYYLADKNNGKTCFIGESSYKDQCSSSNWHEKW
jgi:hypothetical protein